jgi:N-acetylglutamate synthase-like GNAT family acetyltransferase
VLNQLSVDASVAIRRAIRADKEPIAALHRELNRPRRRVGTSDYFVACVGAELVGCAAAIPSGEVGYLFGLGVRKRWRRQGVGSALTVTRLEAMLELGCRRCYVFAMFWNIGFFRRLGFSRVDKKTLMPRIEHSDFSAPWNRNSALMVFEWDTTSQQANVSR